MRPRTTSVCTSLALVLCAASASCRQSADDDIHDSAVGSVSRAAAELRLGSDTVTHGLPENMADPDQRFLHWMLAHHAEVVYLAHQGSRHRDSALVRDVARAVDRSHDAESARMQQLLRSEFGDTALPGMRKEHVAMVTPFEKMSREEYGPAFRSFLAAHHAEAVRMIDSVSARLRRPAVRDVATELRAARQRDIERLRSSAARQ